MKKELLTSMAGALAILLPLSCSRTGSESVGLARLSLQSDWEVTDVTRSNVADYTTLPQAEQFTLSIKDAGDNETPVAAGQGTVELAAGSYTAKAVFGSVSDEGFDKPCFSGSSDFVIVGGSTTDVSINVKLANCLVRVETTEQFRNYYSDWTFTVTSGAGTAVPFGKDETRAAFFDAYLIKVQGSLVNQGGKTLSFPLKEYKNLEAAKCYTLKFDVSNVGGSSITVTFDDSVEDVALGSFELNE